VALLKLAGSGIRLAEYLTELPSKEVLARFPVRVLMTHGLVPLEEQDGEVLVASSRLFDSAGLDELRLDGLPVEGSL
jgi:hypothetical protein